MRDAATAYLYTYVPLKIKKNHPANHNHPYCIPLEPNKVISWMRV